LVIDDDPAVRDLLARTLEADGFRVLQAADGAEGLRLARERRPDAITLDIMLPEMNGWAVLGELKGDPAVCDTPVVMLSVADADDGPGGRGVALGASEYLTKPVDRDRLVRLLRRFCDPAPAGPVLVVEDDPDARDVLCRVLEKEGVAVVTAANGRLALDAMAAGRLPSLVLLDLMMPEMDGFAFAVALRQNPAWEAVPVVVITAKQMTDEDHRRLSGRVAGVLAKGAYDRPDLLALVRRLIGRPAWPAATPTRSETPA
jgi:CheY-like chemotaxis protein